MYDIMTFCCMYRAHSYIIQYELVDRYINSEPHKCITAVCPNCTNACVVHMERRHLNSPRMCHTQGQTKFRTASYIVLLKQLFASFNNFFSDAISCFSELVGVELHNVTESVRQKALLSFGANFATQFLVFLSNVILSRDTQHCWRYK